MVDREPRRARTDASALAACAPRPASAIVGLAPLVADIGAHLRAALRREAAERRPFHGVPIAFGVGILLYFTADREPHLLAPAVGLTLTLAACWPARRTRIVLALLLALSAMFAGFAAGSLRTLSIASPVIDRPVIAVLTGFTETVDPRVKGSRILLRVTSMEGRAIADAPYRVRLTFAQKGAIRAGDHVQLKARLLPPPEASRPGGYDFARESFFRRTGAVGSVLGVLVHVPASVPMPLGLSLKSAIDGARNALTARIAGAIGGQAGALAAALVTGKRDLLTEESNDAMRAAGLYHVVSISGLHMVIAAGAFFWIIRAGLTLVPHVALRWPVKKLAAAGAMTGASAYCVFTGADVATERSLVMILIMLGAVLVDRPALSMRNLSIAALIVLARAPESLLGPSFQMSFAAVAALIAAAETLRDRRTPNGDHMPRMLPRVVRYAAYWAGGLIGTTIVATIATARFAAYHFQRLAPFGLIGNALALPFVSIIVMPCALLGVLLHPFGLDRAVWEVMGFGTQTVLDIAGAVAAIEGAVHGVSAFFAGALLLLSSSLLWFVVWRTWLRMAALLPLVLGIWLAAQPERVDLFFDRNGDGAALRGPDGRMTLLGRPSAFVGSIWLQADGDVRQVRDMLLAAKTRCDRLGCTSLDRQGRAVALVADARAFPEDCARAAIVLTRLVAPATCKPTMVIDRRVLDLRGAISITFQSNEATVRGTRDLSRMRPWDPTRRAARDKAPVPATSTEASRAPGQDSQDDPQTTTRDDEADQ